MGKSKMIERTRERVSRLCRKVDVSFVGRFFHFIWDSLLVCSLAPPPRYTRLPLPPQLHLHGHHLPSPPLSAPTHRPSDSDSDSDSVSLKISLLGDKAIGKTSFLIKYVGDEQQKRSLQMKGLTLLDKTLLVRGARISFTIWDVAGDREASHQIPMACKDAVAILFLFDLTSRPTLNSVVGWFSEARKWNQTALPILIGTKFDDFVRLPPDVQWTIVAQARAYARAMKATLFFSSARHNINVNKIFKFIMAKLFNLPWKVERNLTLGEPIIDFF